MTYTARDCLTCGLPLPPQRAGRPRVVHPGACARARADEIDEVRREDRYREALRDAAVRAPLADPESVLGGSDDGDEAPLPARLAVAGFAEIDDDPAEGLPRVYGLRTIGEGSGFTPGVPERERAYTQHRRAVLASLAPTFAEERRKRTPGKAFTRSHDVTRCYGCPAFDLLAVVAVVTPESLIRGREEAREDAAVRRHLAEDDLAAIMARRPS